MKKLMILLVALGLTIGTMSVNTVLADEGGNLANVVCTALNDLGGTHGECVSFGRTAPVEFCQELKKSDFLGMDWLAVFGFKNQGECVSTIRSIGL